MSSKQVIVTSTLDSTYWSVLIQDFLTGTQIATFKESITCCYNGLAVLFDQYLLCSQKDSSVVHLWSLRKKSSVRTRMKCPSTVTCLTVTPDGMFIVLGLEEKIYIYQTSSGQLCSVLARHYQPITCLRMSSCGSFFISGSEDGLILVWELFKILDNGLINSNSSNDYSGNLNPKHTFSYHTSKITDICCGDTGIRGKCCSVSVDSTCKIYDLYSGVLLVNISFDEPLWSVTWDCSQNLLFVGGEKGTIYETKLYDQQQNLHDLNKPQPTLFKGHSSKVTHLAVSLDGLALVSGSHDSKVIIWHIISKQQMRSFEHKGAITNLLVMPTPRGILEEDHPLKLVKPFKLTIDSNLDPLERDIITVVNDEIIKSESDDEKSIPFKPMVKNFDEDLANAPEQIEKLKHINAQLYQAAANAIFKNIAKRK